MSLIEKIQPFNGRMVVEIIEEDVLDYLRKRYKMTDSVLELPASMTENKYVPRNKGKIVKIAPDAFGEAFKKRYGDNGKYPEIGDVVIFLSMQSEPIDVEGKYHLVADNSTVAFYKEEKVEAKV